MVGSFTLNVEGTDVLVPLNHYSMGGGPGGGCAELPATVSNQRQVGRTSRARAYGLSELVMRALDLPLSQLQVTVDVGSSPNADGCEWTLMFSRHAGI